MSINKKRMQKMYKVSWKEFDYLCECLALGIKASGMEPKNIYGIPRGGLVVAVKLSHILNIPLTTKEDYVEVDQSIICDDLTDGGITLMEYRELTYAKTATLYHNKNSVIEPDFWVKYKPDGWVLFPWETLETTK